MRGPASLDRNPLQQAMAVTLPVAGSDGPNAVDCGDVADFELTTATGRRSATDRCAMRIQVPVSDLLKESGLAAYAA